MLTRSRISLLNLPVENALVPIVETRIHFLQALEATAVRAMLLHHCNIFEFSTLLERASRSGCAIYINMDHIDGIYADEAGFRYLAESETISGVISSHPRALATAKRAGLETIQRIFAVDSTGLKMALDSVDLATVDMLDFSPARVVPYIMPRLHRFLVRPFMASGLLQTREQSQAVLRTGARAIAVNHPERWL